jgi:hypothetical protein
MTATALLAAHPGPATHLALLGITIVIGLIVFAVVSVRNRREAAEAERLDQTTETKEHEPEER